MGRPRKNPDELIDKTVSVGLSQADYDAWQAKVDASGLTKSEFFREAILANRTKVVARPRASADKVRLLFLANKASNNINQLAHRANSDHLAGKLSEGAYSALLYELQALNRFLKASAQNVD